MQFYSWLLIHTELYMCIRFAAEIFHDLHEEAMATASRGHGLMLRLQQLEAEFPAVEKAIISQTEHSNYPHDDGLRPPPPQKKLCIPPCKFLLACFFYKNLSTFLVGAEWHSNVQLKQNVITQGDMPRFIMDSYEECRGPPQLFTLDKYGAVVFCEHLLCAKGHLAELVRWPE
jgi:hypothetical protein